MPELGNAPTKAEDTEDSAETKAGSDPLSAAVGPFDAYIPVSAGRLRQRVPWALRDERHEKEALDAALAKLLDREDFTQDEVDALQEAHEEQYSGRWYREALTEEQVADLAARFALPEAALKDVSRRLAAALTPALEPVLVGVSREDAEKRAGAMLGKAGAHLMKSSEEALKAFELVQGLVLSGSGGKDEGARFERARREHEEVLLGIERLYRRYRALGRRPGVLLDLDALDRRTVGDPRRRKILFLLFGVWADSGRALTITTDPVDNSRRTGPLVAFVNAIVRCVTEPASELSGETVWQDLKAYRAMLSQG